jgi:hypothetical protein
MDYINFQFTPELYIRQKLDTMLNIHINEQNIANLPELVYQDLTISRKVCGTIKGEMCLLPIDLDYSKIERILIKHKFPFPKTRKNKKELNKFYKSTIPIIKQHLFNIKRFNEIVNKLDINEDFILSYGNIQRVLARQNLDSCVNLDLIPFIIYKLSRNSKTPFNGITKEEYDKIIEHTKIEYPDNFLKVNQKFSKNNQPIFLSIGMELNIAPIYLLCMGIPNI